MQAPLGRAVIGGLVMSTFATLLVLPSLFAMIIGRKVATSPSIYPDDPDSIHYDPNVFVDAESPEEQGKSNKGERAVNGSESTKSKEPADYKNSEVVAFLGQILNEARSHRRNSMTTHFTVEDLLVALGFSTPEAENLAKRRAEGRSSSLDSTDNSKSVSDSGKAPRNESEPSQPNGES